MGRSYLHASDGAFRRNPEPDFVTLPMSLGRRALGGMIAQTGVGAIISLALPPEPGPASEPVPVPAPVPVPPPLPGP